MINTPIALPIIIALTACTAPAYAFNGFSTQPVTPWRNAPSNQSWHTPQPDLYRKSQEYRQDQLMQDLRRDLDQREMDRYSSPPIQRWR